MASFRSPKLDDRSYDDLRRELVRRIPVHSAEWTDHNASDPGIALLEVFAWLGENLLHRMNRVPDKAQLEFLRLLDVPPRTASPSRALVRLGLSGTSTAPQLLPFGPTAERTIVAAGKIELQVEDEIQVLPLDAITAIKAVPSITDPEKIEGEKELRQAIEDHYASLAAADPAKAAKEPELVQYTTKILAAPEAGVAKEPVAVGLAVDRSLWIALLVPKQVLRKPADPPSAKKTPAEIRALVKDLVLSIGVVLDQSLCGPADVERRPDPEFEDRALPVIWQISTGKFHGATVSLDQLRYDRLTVQSDTTLGLSRSGVVRLVLPREEDAFGTWEGSGLSDALAGAGDLPPLVEDEKIAERIVAWIRAFRPAPAANASPLPQPVVRWADVNMVSCEQAITAAPEILGNGTGRPNQSVRVAHAPVIAGSLHVEVREPVGFVAWTEVDHFAASGPADPHYILDPATGEIRFGDGVRGRMPRPGETIRARTYRYGGGAIGNVPPGGISKVRPPRDVSPLTATNPFAAEGGVDGETIEEARRRVPQVIRHGERAVCADDFRDLAMETPAACLGRVEVLPRHKPQERVDGVPGVVTLVVVPAYDPLHPDEPVPDRETLRRVCAHLEPRRLVTTELYVTPPEYVPVWVSAAFEVDDEHGVQTVKRWVDLAIRQHLAPLPPYGPAGGGWPFGRTVSARDVEAAILRVEGVALVNGVIVQGPIGADGKPIEGAVTLAKWQLPVVRGVQLTTTSKTPDPIERDGDSERPTTATPMPVPVVEEVC